MELDKKIPWRSWTKATLKGHGCPYCKAQGSMVLKRLLDYEVAGKVVPVAYVNVCSDCGGHVVTEAVWELLTA